MQQEKINAYIKANLNRVNKSFISIEKNEVMESKVLAASEIHLQAVFFLNDGTAKIATFCVFGGLSEVYVPASIIDLSALNSKMAVK